MADDDKMLIVPLGEESRIITQAIANDTARKILELLAESPMSTSSIAKRMDIPLTTAQYNIEKLMEAGLVIVEKTKYSEKGREVKLYAPAKRMIVLVPRSGSSQSLIDALKKYLVILPIAAVASLLVEAAMQVHDNLGGLKGMFTSSAAAPNAFNPASDANQSLMTGAGNNSPMFYSMPAPAPTSASPVPVPTTAPPWFGPDANALPTPQPGMAPGASTLGMGNGVNATEPTSYIGEVARNGTTIDSTGSGSYGIAGQISGHVAATGTPAGEVTSQASSVSGTGSAQSFIPTDLLNHWGLWFFIGCLLIIGIMIAFDLYARHRANKK